MRERWRQPAEVLDLGSHPLELVQLSDGRVVRAAEVVYAAETIERMRLGFMCANCLEPFQEAWPERCNVCGVPVATKQAEFFAREFGGVLPLGSATSFERERERLREYVEEEGL